MKAFKDKEQARKWILKKHPLGTPRESITATRGVVHDETGVWQLFDAPHHTASRHYVDSEGNSRSAEVKQSWMVVYLFDRGKQLKDMDVFLVPR